MDYDFCGWATRNDLKCTDGRTIRKDAFKDNDGQKVPLVWNHQHNEAFDVLGHAMLKTVTKVFMHIVNLMIPSPVKQQNFLFSMAM